MNTAHSRPWSGRALLATSLLILIITVPAVADHSYSTRGSTVGYGHIGGLRFAHRSSRASDCDPQLEYERGLARGHRRGAKVGYKDGFTGRRFCGTPARDLTRHSPYFARGYLEAYGRAYAEGYRRGRAACGAHVNRRHRYR